MNEMKLKKILVLLFCNIILLNNCFSFYVQASEDSEPTTSITESETYKNNLEKNQEIARKLIAEFLAVGGGILATGLDSVVSSKYGDGGGAMASFIKFYEWAMGGEYNAIFEEHVTYDEDKNEIKLDKEFTDALNEIVQQAVNKSNGYYEVKQRTDLTTKEIYQNYLFGYFNSVTDSPKLAKLINNDLYEEVLNYYNGNIPFYSYSFSKKSNCPFFLLPDSYLVASPSSSASSTNNYAVEFTCYNTNGEKNSSAFGMADSDMFLYDSSKKTYYFSPRFRYGTLTNYYSEENYTKIKSYTFDFSDNVMVIGEPFKVFYSKNALARYLAYGKQTYAPTYNDCVVINGDVINYYNTNPAPTVDPDKSEEENQEIINNYYNTVNNYYYNYSNPGGNTGTLPTTATFDTSETTTASPSTTATTTPIAMPDLTSTNNLLQQIKNLVALQGNKLDYIVTYIQNQNIKLDTVVKNLSTINGNLLSIYELVKRLPTSDYTSTLNTSNYYLLEILKELQKEDTSNVNLDEVIEQLTKSNDTAQKILEEMKDEEGTSIFSILKSLLDVLSKLDISLKLDEIIDLLQGQEKTGLSDMIKSILQSMKLNGIKDELEEINKAITNEDGTYKLDDIIKRLDTAQISLNMLDVINTKIKLANDTLADIYTKLSDIYTKIITLAENQLDIKTGLTLSFQKMDELLISIIESFTSSNTKLDNLIEKFDTSNTKLDTVVTALEVIAKKDLSVNVESGGSEYSYKELSDFLTALWNESDKKLDNMIELLEDNNEYLKKINTSLNEIKALLIADSIMETFRDRSSETANKAKEKFPTSIPWDIALVVNTMKADPKAPVLTIPIKIDSLHINEELKIDLSGDSWDKLAKTSRYFLSVLFVLYLVSLTRKLFFKDDD